MKKLLTIALAMLMLFGLCACDENSQAGNAGGGADNNNNNNNVDKYANLTPYETLFANVGLCVQDENGLWGYINKDGDYVIEPQFADAFSFDEKEELARVQSADKGLYGYINNKGEYVIEPQFTSANKFVNDLAIVSIDGKVCYIDYDGQIVISGDYDAAYNFSDDMALVKQNDLYGYINRQGEMIISPQFVEAYSFVDGVAYVQLESDPVYYESNSYMLIDKDGNNLLNGLRRPQSSTLNREPTIDMDLYCKAQLSENGMNYVYQFVNKQGDIIMPQTNAGYTYYPDAMCFSDGYAVVRDSESRLYGVIDKDGNWVVAPMLQSTPNLGYCDDKNICIYKVDNRNIDYFCFDERGNLVKKVTLHGYDYVSYANYEKNFMCLRSASGCQFADFDGNLLMDYVFEATAGWRFNDIGLDCAIVKYNGLYGIIDGGGNWLIEPKFQNVRQ